MADIEKYERLCDDDKKITVELTRSEQAAVLKAYDYGVAATDKALLEAVIAKLKDEIWQ